MSPDRTVEATTIRTEDQEKILPIFLFLWSSSGKVQRELGPGSDDANSEPCRAVFVNVGEECILLVHLGSAGCQWMEKETGR